MWAPQPQIWMDSSFIPFLFSCASLLWIVASSVAKRISKNDTPSAATPGLITRAYTWARAAGCVSLLGLSIATLVLHRYESAWAEYAWTCTFAYTTILSLTGFTSSSLVVVLASALTTLAYRDLYPLATFHQLPLDSAQGNLIWAKLAVLFIVAAIIPLVIPRAYTPVNPQNPSKGTPEQTASWASLLAFNFVSPVISTAQLTDHLTKDQLSPLNDTDTAAYLKMKTFIYLDPVETGSRRHIFWGLLRIFSREYLVGAVMLIMQTVGQFAAPVGINRLLNYLETNGDGAYYRPWFWIAWLFLAPVISLFTFQHYLYLSSRCVSRAESMITQLVFEHALRIRVKAEVQHEVKTTSGRATPAEDENTGAGKTASVASSTTAVKQPAETEEASNTIGMINNLVTTDLENIVASRDLPLVFLYVPMQIIGCLTFLYVLLGWAAFVGFVVVVVLAPLPGLAVKLGHGAQEKRMKTTDARVQIVTETMSVIRMIKLFGWEEKTKAKIAKIRAEELGWVRYLRMINAFTGLSGEVIPVLMLISTFFVYAAIMKESLSASKVFSSLTVIGMLQNQLFTIMHHLQRTIEGKISLDRVHNFLHNTELLDEKVVSDFAAPPPADDKAIGFRDASFTWANDEESNAGAQTPSRRAFNLHIDELYFQRGGLNLVLGPTSSGKTSLLHALLGEMHFLNESPSSWYNLPRSGGVSYAAQENWVINDTIRGNILFGSPFNAERYEKVLHQCALQRDLSLFEAGDMTEVGARGLVLSGGQKARVTLARAMYSSAEIVLLDDVLAALDVHTARWIVEKCLAGPDSLAFGRTIIMVTHNIALVSPIADFAVSLGLDGRVTSVGSVRDALEKNETLAKEVAKEEAAVEVEEKVIDAVDPDIALKPSDGKLIMEEDVDKGHVSWPALKIYLIALGGKRPITFWTMTFTTLALFQLADVLVAAWLGVWSSQYDNHPATEVPVYWYMSIYVLIWAVQQFFNTASVIIFRRNGAARASESIHDQLTVSILGSTSRWLDVTPVSRIITRITKDIHAIDDNLPNETADFLVLTTIMVFKLLAIVYLTPIFLIFGAVVFIIGVLIGQRYIKAQLSTKREMSNASAPVIGHFEAAIGGLTSIRAYGLQERFRVDMRSKVDIYTPISRTYHNLNLWIQIRLDLIGSIFSTGLAAWLIYASKVSSAAEVGFSMTMAAGFSGYIIWWVRTVNEFEVFGNNLERIYAYLNIEQEPKPTKKGIPPAYWPSSGEIYVEKLSARYSVHGPTVLRDLSFHIKSGERVGIVGRTGSGKSTLGLALLRAIPTEGTVTYDGLATSSLNLDSLRGAISIIPQTPELLSGTLRDNLDPFQEYDDSRLYDALRSAGLFSLQEDMEDGQLTLDSPVSSGGSNLSVGTRQILALARAIVRESKFLILDEATSAIDYKTDTIIQSSLRNELPRDVSVLTVAHRLVSVMDSDKIMVLDAGRMVEFDSPRELLKIPSGYLRKLVDDSGDKEALYAMAGASK